MSRNIRLYYLFRALSCAHVFKWFTYFYCMSRGLSVFEWMLLFTIFSVAVILFEVPTGAWADRLGRRRSMALGALLMGAASLGYLVSHGFAAFAVCEFVFAVGLTLTSGADSAFLYDILKEAGRSEEYLRLESKAGMAKHVGLTVAALVGGVLAWIDLRLPYAVTAIVCLIAAGVALGMSGGRAAALRGRSEGEPKSRSTVFGPLAEALKKYMSEGTRTIRQTPALMWAILYSSMIFVIIRMSEALYQPVLKSQGFGYLAMGLVYAGLNLMAAFSARGVSRFSRVVGEKFILWALPVMLIVSYLLLDALGPVMCVVLMSAQYTVTGIYSPFTKSLINHEINTSRVRATVLSAESATKRLVVALVSPAVGLIISYFSLRAGLYACAAVAFLGTVAVLMVVRRHRRAPTGPLAAEPGPTAVGSGLNEPVAVSAPAGPAGSTAGARAVGTSLGSAEFSATGTVEMKAKGGLGVGGVANRTGLEA